MNNKQNVRKLTDLLEYLKERHSNLPTLPEDKKIKEGKTPKPPKKK